MCTKLAMGWGTEELWFDSQQGQNIYLVSEASRLTLPTVQWVSGRDCFESRPGHGYCV